jgi:hypothetical protein
MVSYFVAYSNKKSVCISQFPYAYTILILHDLPTLIKFSTEYKYDAPKYVILCPVVIFYWQHWI